jgi:uncharacterized protein
LANAPLSRHLVPELEAALAHARIVNLIGPRQAGKTTVVRDLLGRGRYITLDDETTLAAMDADPVGQLIGLRAALGDAPLIIDEAQRAKSMALAIKQIVDADQRKGQFILTGSSNVFRTAAVADSLAGRMRTLTLWPLSAAEAHEAKPCRLIDWAMQPDPMLADVSVAPISRAQMIEALLCGGFPEIRQMPLRERQRQYRDVIDAMVERDVADIIQIRKPDALRRTIEQMAARSSQELNLVDLSGTLGIRRETTEQYLDILIKLSMLTRLPAWAPGESNRDIKNAKVHFADSGVLCALRRFGPDAFDIGGDPVALGPVLESYVANEVLRSVPLQQADVRLHHWRSKAGREIDILVEGTGQLLGIEVKASATVTAEDFRHLRWFAAEGPGRTRRFTGVVFYLGAQPATFGDRMFALPVSALWADWAGLGS